MKVRLMDKGRGGHKSAADLEAPAKGNRVYYDLEQTGFGLRVTSAGARSFIFNYWIKGRERRLTIGQHPEWSVTAARTEAKRLRVEIDRGNDPLAERKEAHAAPTVADFCERYIEQHLPRKRTRSAGDDAGMIARYVLPALGSMKWPR